MSFESAGPFVVSNGVTQLNAPTPALQLAGSSTPPYAGLIQVLIENTGAATAAVAFAPLAATAQTNATLPGAGTTSASGVIIAPAGMIAVFTVPPGQYWSASAAGVYIQAGVGN